MTTERYMLGLTQNSMSYKMFDPLDVSEPIPSGGEYLKIVISADCDYKKKVVPNTR